MAKRKWLDEQEQRAWIGLMASTVLLDAALDHQLQRDAGISHATFGVLTALSQAPGRELHMNELAMATSSSQSRLSHAVARLEANGWIERSRCADNKRQVHARLTDAGFAVVRNAAPGHVKRVRALLFDRLTSEQVDELGEITQVLLGSLAAAGYNSPLSSEAQPTPAPKRA